VLQAALALFGVALIVSGVVAVVRRRARVRADGDIESSTYEGGRAMLLGAVWILLGVGVLVFAFGGPGGPTGWLYEIGGALLGR
jgi:hypothetical protein